MSNIHTTILNKCLVDIATDGLNKFSPIINNVTGRECGEFLHNGSIAIRRPTLTNSEASLVSYFYLDSSSSGCHVVRDNDISLTTEYSGLAKLDSKGLDAVFIQNAWNYVAFRKKGDDLFVNINDYSSSFSTTKLFQGNYTYFNIPYANDSSMNRVGGVRFYERFLSPEEISFIRSYYKEVVFQEFSTSTLRASNMFPVHF